MCCWDEKKKSLCMWGACMTMMMDDIESNIFVSHTLFGGEHENIIKFTYDIGYYFWPLSLFPIQISSISLESMPNGTLKCGWVFHTYFFHDYERLSEWVFLWKIHNFSLPLLKLPSLRNFSFASCFRLAMMSASLSSFCISMTVCVESFEPIDISELISKLLSVEIFGRCCMTGVVESMGVFDTFEMVTVVLIDCGCCFSIVFCLFNVANDITIWSQCDERSFLAYMK